MKNTPMYVWRALTFTGYWHQETINEYLFANSYIYLHVGGPENYIYIKTYKRQVSIHVVLGSYFFYIKKHKHFYISLLCAYGIF